MQISDVCLAMKLFLKLKLLFGMRSESKKMEKIFSANSLISSSSRFSMMAIAAIMSWWRNDELEVKRLVSDGVKDGDGVVELFF